MSRLGNTAFDGHHVHIDVAIIFATKCDGLVVGREPRRKFVAFRRRQPMGVGAIAIRNPQITVVAKCDMACTDRGILQHPRVFRVLRLCLWRKAKTAKQRVENPSKHRQGRTVMGLPFSSYRWLSIRGYEMPLAAR